MAISSRLLRHLLLSMLILSVFAPPLAAQSSRYFIDPNSEEPRLIQRLAWSGGANALRYEVVIEKLEGESYIIHQLEFTTELFVDVSLAAGDYRFRVIPYDILDRPGQGSRWIRLEVRPALRPEISDASQETFNAEDDFYIFRVDGNNLLPDSEIFFIDGEGGRIAPVRAVGLDDGGLLLLFDKSQLVTGEYGLSVKNPGGMEAAMDGISFVAPEPASKSAHLPLKHFGAFWMPVLKFPVESFEKSLILSGAAVNMSAVFPLPAGFYIGPELTTAWYTFTPAPAKPAPGISEEEGGEETEQDVTQKQSLTIGINLLAGKWLLNNVIAVNIRVGADYTLLSEGNVSLNAGASFLWQVVKFLYVEVGANYSLMFDKDMSNSLRPWIGIGCQF